jgi:hypothetical protein
LGGSSSSQLWFLSTPPTLTDNTAALFNQGTSTGTAWDASNGSVRLDHAGTATALELSPSWTPAWSNIVGYWKMNEASWNGTAGEVIDSSGNGNHGTSMGCATTTSSSILGAAAGSFNGTNCSYVHIPSIPGAQANYLTVATWFKTTAAGGATMFISNHQPGPWYLCTLGSNNIHFMLQTTAVRIDYSPSTPYSINDGNWHHVVATYDGAAMKVYIDGTLLGSTPQSGAISSAGGDLEIGTYNFGTATYNWNGLMDDAAIWNTALSASAVSTIYQHQLAKYAGTFQSRVIDGLSLNTWSSLSWISTLPFGKPLPDTSSENSASYPSIYSSSLMTGIAGLWHLDEPAGATSALDHSGLGNHGTPSNVTFGGSGVLGTSASLNGSSVISIGGGFFPWANDFTISTWAYPSASMGGGENILTGFETYLTWGFRFGISLNYWTFWTGESGGSIGVASPQTAALGQWTHVTVTYSRSTSTAKLYINGVLVTTGTGNFVVPPVNGMYIGAGIGGTANWNGKIDEYAVWSRALQPAEVLQLYRRGANRIRYQVRSCPDSTCSTNPAWQGTDNSNQTYLSELNNNAIPTDAADLNSSDSVLSAFPQLRFSSFGVLSIPNNRYFQYRAVMESDDTGTGCNYGSGPTWCSPELKSATVGAP